MVVPFSLSAQTATIATTGYDLSSTEKTVTIVVPLLLDKMTIDEFVLNDRKPDNVMLGQLSLPRFRDAISLDTDKRDALRVNVQLDKLDIQGTYVINFRYYYIKLPAILRKLSITVVRKAALLQSLNPVVVINDKSTDLVLMETTNQTGINNLFLTSPFTTAPETNGLITFPNNPYSLGPGRVLAAKLHVDPKKLEDMPYGQYKGKLQINSPLLTVPLIVDFDVSKRRAKWVILLAVLIGLVVGQFVRHFLQDQQDLEKARLSGFQLIQQMISDTKDISDKEYRKTITDLIKQTEAAIYAKNVVLPPNASRMTTTIQTISNQYTADKTAFQTLMANQKAAYNVTLFGSHQQFTSRHD